MLTQRHPVDLTGEQLEHFIPYLNQLVDTIDGDVSANTILTSIKQGTVALAKWTRNDVFGCYLLFERESTDNGDALVVSGVIGDTFDDYEPFHQACVALARAANCTSIRLRGRRGLWKKYRALGYTESYTIYSYKLPPITPVPLVTNHRVDGSVLTLG